MKDQKNNLLIATLIVLVAAVSRVVLYPNNFSPIIGMALFAGAIFQDKKYAFALPLAAMLLSDILFEISGIANGFWGYGQIVGYGILGLITVFAFNLKNPDVLKIFGFSLASSILFFLLSNLSVFLFDKGQTYPMSWEGLQQCYIMGLPFLRTGIVADLVYSFLFFGVYFLAIGKNILAIKPAKH